MNKLLPKVLVDPYDRPARLYPGLLVLMPIAVLLVCLYGKTGGLQSSVLSVLGFCGVGFALARICRDAGKRLQDSLFHKWGGAPTTQLLRHRDSTLDPHTKARFHDALARGIGQSFPTADGERLDPEAADYLYRAGVIWLIGQTRNSETFPLVLKENIAFGFHRNSLGVRPVGVVVTAVCIVWGLRDAGALTLTSPCSLGVRIATLDPAHVITLCISAVMLATWFCWLNEKAAKRAAFAYAERLLQSCDALRPQSGSAVPKSTRTSDRKNPE